MIWNSVCRICGDDIEYLDPGNDIGGWWAHRHHPADEHDAVPRDGRIAGIIGP